MSALSLEVAALTDAERSRIRRELYAEKILDWSFIREALGEAKQPQWDVIRWALEHRDGNLLLEQWEILIRQYIESERFPEAEEDFIGAKS